MALLLPKNFRALSSINSSILKTPSPYRTRPPLLTLTLQVRQASGQFSGQSPFFGISWAYIRYTYRMYPIALPSLVAAIFFGFCLLIYFIYLYFCVHHAFSNYPEDVGLKIRRAWHFTETDPDAQQAVKAHVQAIHLARAHGMDPYGNEVIAMRVEFARVMEKFNNPAEAILLLTNVKKEGLEWLAKNEHDPKQAGRRTDILKWCCKLSVRIADLYTNPKIADEALVEENLVWAVETSIRESQRRAKEGLREGEGEWLTPDEQGSEYERLADYYEWKRKFYFAAQLYLQALMIKPERDCHSVILMNNLATTMVQQAPPVMRGEEWRVETPSDEQLRESARKWLRQALALAETIEPPNRTSECDQGCAVAIHNLGEFAEMDGNIKEARERFEEAGSLAHAIDFKEGIRESDAGLKRLETGEPIPFRWKWPEAIFFPKVPKISPID